MQSSEYIEQSLYSAYDPVIVNDLSLIHSEEVVMPVSTPPLSTDNWGSNKSFKWSMVFNENSNSISYNTKKSRIENDLSLTFATTSGVALSLQIVNSVLSLGRYKAGTFYDGGFIKNYKVSVNNTPLNNSQTGKNFSKHMIKKIRRTCESYDEYKSTINALCWCGDDIILCPDKDDSTFENDLYNKMITESTVTMYSTVWKALKKIKGATKYLTLSGDGIIYGTATVEKSDNVIPISVSNRLKDIVDIFETADYFSSSQINSLDIEQELNAPAYISAGDNFIINGARIVFDKYMQNMASTKKMLSYNNTENLFCKFVSCTSIIDTPTSTAFAADTYTNFDGKTGNRQISGIGAIESFTINDVLKNYPTIINTYSAQYIPIPVCIESLIGSSIDGQSLPLQDTLFDITKYEMYKASLPIYSVPFDRSVYDKLGFITIRSPMISNTCEMYSIRDGHTLSINVRNGTTVKLRNNAGLELSCGVIERDIIADLRQIYYCKGRLSGGVPPSGLRLVSGSQTLSAEQVEEAIEAKFSGMSNDMLYIQKD